MDALLHEKYVNSANVSLLRRALAEGCVSGDFLPAVYVVEPVSRCNLACVMCPNRRMPESDLGEMNLQTFTSIMKEISPYCEFLMLYWMGEPTLHPQINEILHIARRYISGRIVVSTNMTSSDESVYSALLDNADIVLCCIDRWEKTAYERIRVGADFEQVVGNTERLLAMRQSASPCEIVVKALDLNAGSAEGASFSKYWAARGARPLIAWLNDWAGTFSSMRNAATVPVPRMETKRIPCADLWFKLVVNWRGEAQMCCFDWQYKYTLGRAASHGDWLREIWHSKPVTALRQSHLEAQWNVTPLCASCTTWGEPAELDAYVDFAENSYFTVF